MEQKIYAEGDSVDAVREQLKSQVPEGFQIRLEQILSDGKPITVKESADTGEAAFAKAESKIPAEAEVISRKELTPAKLHTVTIEANNEQDLQSNAKFQVRTKFNNTATVRGYKLSVAGRKGFLGVGAKPNQYEVEILQQAVVEITYKMKVKMSAVIDKIPDQVAQSPVAGMTPKCSKCGRQLEYAGNPLAHVGDNASHTWRGTVCTSCGHIYCDRCNVVDAVPCPNCGAVLKPAMLLYLETALALSKVEDTEVDFYQYEMNHLPKGDGRCSDRQCPCPETLIPRGTGYLYISPEAVGFMKSQKNGLGGGGFMVFGSMPVLTCKQGAELRGLDMKVAAEDAKRWWETGKVPLRPTPIIKKGI